MVLLSECRVKKVENIIFRIFTLFVEMMNQFFSLDGEQIEGTIPAPKKKLVEAWMEIHKDELAANWKLLDEGEQYFKIEPLK